MHSARFLGNYILYGLARLLDACFHSPDIRFHPLRIAAGMLTPLYFVIGVSPIFSAAGTMLNWRVFLVGYAALFVSGMYIFYPCDAPSLALFSIGVFSLLRNRMPEVFTAMALMMLFRESAFHLVVLAAMWSATCRVENPARRLAWIFILASFFVIEYKLIRFWFPGPLTGTGQLLLSREIFTGGALLSPTSLVTLPLVALPPLVYLCVRNPDQTGVSLDKFFLLNCLAVPLWLIFYRVLGGNITEFRLLWPVLLPIIYGIAWIPWRP
ncbi:MAG: hypothetical protein LBU39_01735 [Desulfobulbaceae bacterium]|nr:hypothetical protein [Desulfobulbaceae bacterium]